IGIEARIAEGTETAAMNIGQPKGGQSDTRQLIKISHEAPGIATWPEGVSSDGVLLDEGLANFRTDLEGVRPNCRAKPGQQLLGRSVQRLDCCLQHPTR